MRGDVQPSVPTNVIRVIRAIQVRILVFRMLWFIRMFLGVGVWAGSVFLLQMIVFMVLPEWGNWNLPWITYGGVLLGIAGWVWLFLRFRKEFALFRNPGRWVWNWSLHSCGTLRGWTLWTLWTEWRRELSRFPAWVLEKKWEEFHRHCSDTREWTWWRKQVFSWFQVPVLAGAGVFLLGVVLAHGFPSRWKDALWKWKMGWNISLLMQDFQIQWGGPHTLYEQKQVEGTLYIFPPPGGRSLYLRGEGALAGYSVELPVLSSGENQWSIRMFVREGATARLKVFSRTPSSRLIGELVWEVIPHPRVEKGVWVVYPPEYTGLPVETLALAPLHVPEGSRVKTLLSVRHTGKIEALSGGEDSVLLLSASSEVQTVEILWQKNFWLESDTCWLVFWTKDRLLPADTLMLPVSVIQDAPPELDVYIHTDSLVTGMFVDISGSARDDYGISGIWLEGEWKSSGRSESRSAPSVSFRIPLGMKGTSRRLEVFAFRWKLDTLFLYWQEGADLSVRVVACDNNQVRGPSCTSGPVWWLRIPGKQERIQYFREQASSTARALESLHDVTEKTAENTRDLQEQLFLRGPENLQETPSFREMQEFPERVRMWLETLEEQVRQQRVYLPQDSIFQRWLEEFQKRLREVQSSRLLEKLDSLRETFENRSDPQELPRHLQEWERTVRALQEMLHRLQELWKQTQVYLQWEMAMELLRQMEEQVDQMKGLSQDSLWREYTHQLEDLWKQVEEMLQEADSLNETLEFPYPFELPEEPVRHAREQLQKLQKSLPSHTPPSQREGQREQTRQALQNLRDSLQRQLQNAFQGSAEISLALVETLLDQGLALSQLMEDLTNQVADPRGGIRQTIRAYRSLRVPLYQWGDSFLRLARMLPGLPMDVLDDLFRMEEYYQRGNRILSQEHLHMGKRQKTALQVQRSRYHLNRILSLLQDIRQQVLQQMQMATSMGGARMCPNPGMGSGQNPSNFQLPSFSELQEEIRRQLERLLRDSPSSPSRDSQGQRRSGKTLSEEQRMGKWSRELLRIAMQQMMLRERLEELRQEIQGDGPEVLRLREELRQIAEEMKRMEKELIHQRQVSPHLLERQRELTVRLLRAEEALRRQRLQNQRIAERPEELTPMRGDQHDGIPFHLLELPVHPEKLPGTGQDLLPLMSILRQEYRWWLEKIYRRHQFRSMTR